MDAETQNVAPLFSLGSSRQKTSYLNTGDTVQVSAGEHKGKLGKVGDLYDRPDFKHVDLPASDADVTLFGSDKTVTLQPWDLARAQSDIQDGSVKRPWKISQLEYNEARFALSSHIDDRLMWAFDHVIEFFRETWPDEEHQWAPDDSHPVFQLWLPSLAFQNHVGFWHTDRDWATKPNTAAKNWLAGKQCKEEDLHSVVIPISAPDAGAILRMLVWGDAPAPAEGEIAAMCNVQNAGLPSIPAPVNGTWCILDHRHELGRATVFSSMIVHQVAPFPLTGSSRVSMNLFGVKCGEVRYWIGG